MDTTKDPSRSPETIWLYNSISIIDSDERDAMMVLGSLVDNESIKI